VRELHADATSVLRGWRPSTAAQSALRDEYLAFLAQYPHAMWRTNRIGHLTASALVVDEDRARVLLTLHPKVGRWIQLGGHCELLDATLRDAAVREAIEESGIADVSIAGPPLDLDRHPVRCGDGMSEHLDVRYLAVVPNDSVPSISDESLDLRWFGVDSLPDLDEGTKRMIDAAVNGG
jgi:8-oxo-dGTP pyrophosphatase MutT (NUDIX family)